MLFAATAVGVSHLVQSTRAGAEYGFAFLGLMMLAFVVRYPAFRAAPLYTVITGYTVIEGYRRLGWWALLIYGVVNISFLFLALPTVATGTAGLAKVVLGLDMAIPDLASSLVVGTSLLLLVGRYRWLERVTKALVIFLVVSTVVATLVALPHVHWTSKQGIWLLSGNQEVLLFAVAFVGWMPAPVDTSVIQSLWTKAKAEQSGAMPSRSAFDLDFHIGYVVTAALAFCFMLLGAAVMYGSGVTFASDAVGFSEQLIKLYQDTLGRWSGPLIGLAALAVLFSTMLTICDGVPRSVSGLVRRIKGPEPSGLAAEELEKRHYYTAILIFLATSAIAILQLDLASFRQLVMVAATFSCITAPLIALINQLVLYAPEVAEKARPSAWFLAMGWFGILGLTIFAAIYGIAVFAI